MAPNTYATAALMEDQFGARLFQVLDVADGSDVSGNATLLRCIAFANSAVDSHIRAQYTLPLSAVPDDVVTIACDLAFVKIIEATRGEVLTDADVQLKKDAMAYLSGIARGTMRLTITANTDADGLSASVLDSEVTTNANNADANSLTSILDKF